MKGMLKGLAAFAVVTVLAASAAQAQMPVKFGVAGGGDIPLGTTKDVFKMGFQGTALVQFQPATLPVGIRVDGSYAQLKTKSGVTPVGKEQLIFGTANLVYTFKTAAESRFHPYLIAGGGVYNAKDKPAVGTSSSATKFGFNAGAGFDISAGAANVFVEGRFHDVLTEGDNFKMVPIMVGVKFGGK